MAEEQTSLLKAILEEIRDLKKGNILGDLPRRTNWLYRPFSYSSFSVPDGTENKTICTLDNTKGWIVQAAILHNNPKMVFSLELSTAYEKYKGSTDTNSPYLAGLTQANPAGWWVSKYDAASGLYALMFTPSPWYPFNQTCEIRVTNKSGAPGNITRFYLLAIELKG